MEHNTEKWEAVKYGIYTGYYAVSNIGRVKRYTRKLQDGRIIKEKLLSLIPTKDGYLRVTFNISGALKNVFVHKLVLLAFTKNEYNKPEGNHKNGIKTDNRIENLEWVTKSENILHSFRVLGKKIKNPTKGKFGKNNHSSKSIFCFNTNEVYDSIRIASNALNLNEKSVAAVCRCKFNSIHGFKFKYV